MSDVKHPEVSIQLIGRDGNAFAILGAVQRAMRRAKPVPVPEAEIKEFFDEATSGDYSHLLATVMAWVEVK